MKAVISIIVPLCVGLVDPQPKFLPLDRELTPAEVTLLQNNFRAAYIFAKETTDDTGSAGSIGPLDQLGITKAKIDSSNVQEAVSLFLRSFKQRHANDLKEADLNRIAEKLGPFLTSASDAYLYLKNGTPVALIGLAKNFDHPLLKMTVNHVGAIGYDSLVLTREQARAVKADWKDLIRDSGHGARTTARIDVFNTQSQALFTQFGFQIIGLELESR